MTMVTNRFLLIMVDHSKTALTLSKEFYDLFHQIIVIDHHRRDQIFEAAHETNQDRCA